MTGGVGYDDLARFYKARIYERMILLNLLTEFPSCSTISPVLLCVPYLTGVFLDAHLFQVTPPDTEIITVSRTGENLSQGRLGFTKLVPAVGADRIIDEMIFKATHTTVCSEKCIRARLMFG